MKVNAYFASICILMICIFNKAFSIGFFVDDYNFLNAGKINDIASFFNFFNPTSFSGFFRPIPTQVFYWLIGISNNNYIFAHTIVFVTFFVGLFYLYKILNQIFANSLVALIITFMYSIGFVHVFQLYWFATFQEVCAFTFLLISFYKYINSRYIWSWIFFAMALLCKESAIVYPLFLVGWEVVLWYRHSGAKQSEAKNPVRSFGHYVPSRMTIISFFATSIIFYFLYMTVISKISTSPEYVINFSPKLILNNSMWYFLWSMGFPSVLPDYMVSIFKAPLPEFWKYFKKPDFLYYIIFFVTYGCTFLISLLTIKRTERIQILRLIFICLIFFLISIMPFAVVYHKWMVRLTVPLIFVSIFNGYIIWTILKSKKILGILLLVLFGIYNFFAIRFHEEASTYLIENRIFNNSKYVFSNIDHSINCIFFDDAQVNITSWEGSKKLKTSYDNQSFIRYYFKDQKIRAIYSFENPIVPQNCKVINSRELFK